MHGCGAHGRRHDPDRMEVPPPRPRRRPPRSPPSRPPRRRPRPGPWVVPSGPTSVRPRLPRRMWGGGHSGAKRKGPWWPRDRRRRRRRRRALRRRMSSPPPRRPRPDRPALVMPARPKRPRMRSGMGRMYRLHPRRTRRRRRRRRPGKLSGQDVSDGPARLGRRAVGLEPLILALPTPRTPGPVPGRTRDSSRRTKRWLRKQPDPYHEVMELKDPFRLRSRPDRCSVGVFWPKTPSPARTGGPGEDSTTVPASRRRGGRVCSWHRRDATPTAPSCRPRDLSAPVAGP